MDKKTHFTIQGFPSAADPLSGFDNEKKFCDSGNAYKIVRAILEKGKKSPALPQIPPNPFKKTV